MVAYVENKRSCVHALQMALTNDVACLMCLPLSLVLLPLVSVLLAVAGMLLAVAEVGLCVPLSRLQSGRLAFRVRASSSAEDAVSGG